MTQVCLCVGCWCVQVPSRLAQLLVYLGPNASLSDVLSLTKRCPQVLQVSRAVLVSRMSQLCSLLRRDPASQVSAGPGSSRALNRSSLHGEVKGECGCRAAARP